MKVEVIANPAGWGRHMMGAVNKVNKQKAEQSSGYRKVETSRQSSVI